MKATYASYKTYQQGYYPEWKPEYEQYVMYEFKDISVPTLLIIGQADRTVVGKNMLTEEQKKVYGQYPELGRKIHNEIQGSKLVEFEGVGHIPHIQELGKFREAALGFLE